MSRGTGLYVNIREGESWSVSSHEAASQLQWHQELISFLKTRQAVV